MGYAGSGKDTVARAMKLRYQYERVAFADKLKDLTRRLYPDVDDLVGQIGWDQAKKRKSVRELLQYVGATMRETIDPAVWMHAAAKTINEHVQEGRNVVITDVRYPNEAEMVRLYGGKIVRIERPGTGPVNGHETETNIDDIVADFTLVNDGKIDDIGPKLTKLMKDVGHD